MLEEVGIRILLDDARTRLREAGAAVDDTLMMVRHDSGLVAAAPAAVDMPDGARAPAASAGGKP